MVLELVMDMEVDKVADEVADMEVDMEVDWHGGEDNWWIIYWCDTPGSQISNNASGSTWWQNFRQIQVAILVIKFPANARIVKEVILVTEVKTVK